MRPHVYSSRKDRRTSDVFIKLIQSFTSALNSLICCYHFATFVIISQRHLCFENKNISFHLISNPNEWPLFPCLSYILSSLKYRLKFKHNYLPFTELRISRIFSTSAVSVQATTVKYLDWILVLSISLTCEYGAMTQNVSSLNH